MNAGIPEPIQALCADFVQGLTATLGDNLVGAYLYGAWAFPETGATGDVDFHVILKNSLTEYERTALELMHESLAKKYPPLGGELDGYYLLLSDAQSESPPRSQMWKLASDDAWALHRAHILAGRCIVLYGSHPSQIYPPASWTEIESALYGELSYVEMHLREYPAYCILNLCRLMYSFQTRDVVVSKAASARWALEALPEWRNVIEAARKSYERDATTQEEDLIQAKAREFFDFARGVIEKAGK